MEPRFCLYISVWHGVGCSVSEASGSFIYTLDMVAELEFRGVGLVSLTDAINTTSAQGRLVFNLFASLAEFERELIRGRT